VSWKTVALGEIIELQNGFAFKSSEYAEEGYFLMRITNVQQGFIQNNNPRYVSIPKDSKLKQFILNEGDILMSLTGDVGRVGIVKESNLPAALNQRLARVIIKSLRPVARNYLFNFLNSEHLRTEMESLGHGAAQLNVSTKDILSIQIPLPPLSTQKKIVAKLDAIFAETDKATAAAEANAKNAEALFQSYLSQIFKNKSTDWKETTLNKVCKITNGSTTKRDNPKYWDEGTVSWFTIEDIRRFGRVITETTQHVTQYALEDTSLKILPPNSVVLCCTASVGEYAIIKKEMATNQQFNGLTVTDKNLLPEFLFWYAATMKSMLLSVSGKVTIDFIPISRLKSLPIIFPTVEKQMKIVDGLNSIDSQIKFIKEQYLKKKNELSLLKQSILKQAFAGELVKE